MKICTPVYYFVILIIVTELWFYTYFSKFWIQNKTKFLQQLLSDIIGLSIIVWLLNCMCTGKCENTVWILFTLFLISSVFGIYISHRFNMKSPYQEPPLM